MAHVYTNTPAPLEYIQLVLCRDVFHCAPAQLPDYETCIRALAMIEAEQKAANAKQRAKRR